ncbi:uncharacterized protein BJ171DRAFT_454760 [Polychytrium aggregatum]|uniref:uncharacterized protein n=1 Tax=Polychytrium aggregatum TaxID=110093 RepID=UPI0022FE8FEF|nr:uncharacterized protein BJ171DRAFT_454760 [Polychytrium aggregatum]KAI9209065.1 hypothetical protein BJ171DRAFT_454760 [Polychytrium aggregatum]
MLSAPTKIRIGCVPEHFSSPLYIAEAEKLFQNEGVEVQVVTCPGGTGEMIKFLKESQIDMAIALTEGLVAHIASNAAAGFKIVGTYTAKPLTWSIAGNPSAVPEGASPENVPLEFVKDGKIGVSRMGSGSHIIPFVLADQMGWLQDGAAAPFEFVVLKDIHGLKSGVLSGAADVFLWERFTTKPHYDSGELYHLNNITPPWPAFMFAANDGIVSSQPDAVKKVLAILNQSTARFMAQVEGGQSVDYVQQRFHQKREDVQAWFKTLDYYGDLTSVHESVITKCVGILKNAGVINSSAKVAVTDLVDTRIAKIV